MDDVLSPSLKFLQSMTNVVKNTELKDRIIKNHEPNLARIMFCSGALIDFNDMIRDYELFHMINTMSRFINFPQIRLEDYDKLLKWIRYYFPN